MNAIIQRLLSGSDIMRDLSLFTDQRYQELVP